MLFVSMAFIEKRGESVPNVAKSLPTKTFTKGGSNGIPEHQITKVLI